MGVDLKLLPFDGPYFSFTILPLGRAPDLFQDIAKIESSNIRLAPDNFSSYLSRDDKFEEPHYGLTIETPYGDRLRYVLAGELRHLEHHDDVVGDQRNRAAWSYLQELPDDTKIALYWH
jgi:hypothetical protein